MEFQRDSLTIRNPGAAMYAGNLLNEMVPETKAAEKNGGYFRQAGRTRLHRIRMQWF